MRTILTLFFLSAASINSFGQWPANMFPDSLHYPFTLGVASGDPQTDKVVLWTRVEASKNSVDVHWQISSDSTFSNLVNEGTAQALAQHDHCVKIDATGLQPGKEYFYRFSIDDGATSVTGHTKTLPEKTTEQFKLAVVSCSSVWAGFFNAYRIIANRPDIDFLIHVGDYVYDYPDDRQLKRMPAEPVKDCAGLTDWRERHKYYLLDADLRAARQMKPWIAEWDNHDTDVEPPGETREAIQAFYEYLPIRMPDTLRPENIYRRFEFGNLADLNVIDMQLFRGKEEYEPGKKSVLGLAQDAWLKNSLETSKKQWHLIANQEMMTDWLSEGAPKLIAKKRGNGRVFDTGNWNGFPEDRQRLYDFLAQKNINNVVVLTGDIHMSFVMNMTGNPKNKTLYNKRNGEGAVGVEITGPSISRVNMQESGVPGFLIPLVQRVSMNLNPHHVWCHFTEHGYFTLNVMREKCEAEFWYVPINKLTDREKFARGYTVLNGVNHWNKKPNLKVAYSTRYK